MKYYYVNQINKESSWDKCVIGLFSKCRCSASENYHSEYYHNTRLLAKYEIHGENVGASYEPKQPYKNYIECNKWQWKILIGSHFWTREIIAKSDKEAREIFKRQEWSDGRIFERITFSDRVFMKAFNCIEDIIYSIRNNKKRKTTYEKDIK